jgi:hypothetical protein
VLSGRAPPARLRLRLQQVDSIWSSAHSPAWLTIAANLSVWPAIQFAM